MWEYRLAGNMRFRFLHLIKQVLKSTRYTTGGRCSVSAQASGAESAVPRLEGSSSASHGRRRPLARSLRLGERAIPTQDFSIGADAPWCGSTSRSTQGRDAAPSGSQASGAESAVLSHAGMRDARPTLSRGSAAPVSIHNSKFIIQNSLPAAPSAPPRLRVNPSAILDRMTGFAGYTGT